MSNRTQNECVFDSLFEEAVRQAAENELVELKVTPEDRHIFSREHERKMKAILNRHRYKERFKQALSNARRVVIIFLLVASLLMAVGLFVIK